MYIGDKRKI